MISAPKPPHARNVKLVFTDIFAKTNPQQDVEIVIEMGHVEHARTASKEETVSVRSPSV